MTKSDNNSLDQGGSEPRGTDEIVAEVMPMRRFGKRQAQWAQQNLWPKIRQLPRTHLAPLWRKILESGDLVWMRITRMRRQTRILSVAACALLLVCGVCVAVTPDDRHFVQEQTTLFAGPSLEAGVFEHVGVLEARDPVRVMAEAGDLVLVVDSVGRVGYVARALVGEEPPVPSGDRPFTRCRRLRTEENETLCSARADLQHSECVESCAAVVDVAGCRGNCERRRKDCGSACQLPPQSVGMPAPPVADGQPEGNQAEETVDAKVEEQPKPDKPKATETESRKKKDTKKKPRRRRRRR
ncbi:hypothetical protein ACFL6C_06805 [Myxococcota bacterium]